MSKAQKLFTSAVVVGVLGSFVALGVFGLFSATTQNSGNEISSGTVTLADNDAGSSLFNITHAKPGESWTRCIKVSYNGSLPAKVRLYMSNGVGSLAQYLNLKIIQGTQSSATFPSCTGFTPDATGVVYEGTAQSPTTGSWETGLPVWPATDEHGDWEPGNTLVFKFEISLSETTPDSMQNASLGTSTIVWEARNN